MIDQPIKLGVVGCGFTGRQTIFATTVMSRMTTVALADLDPARREEVAGGIFCTACLHRLPGNP